jgi:hypothetical protein
VHGLPGGLLLAFPQSHSALHEIHYPWPERPDGAGSARAIAVDCSRRVADNGRTAAESRRPWTGDER